MTPCPCALSSLVHAEGARASEVCWRASSMQKNGVSAPSALANAVPMQEHNCLSERATCIGALRNRCLIRRNSNAAAPSAASPGHSTGASSALTQTPSAPRLLQPPCRSCWRRPASHQAQLPSLHFAVRPCCCCYRHRCCCWKMLQRASQQEQRMTCDGPCGAGSSPRTCSCGTRAPRPASSSGSAHRPAQWSTVMSLHNRVIGLG